MHLPKRHLSKHHRARLIAWALAILMWMASVLFAGAPLKRRHLRQRHRRMSLDGLARMVKKLIISRAADLALSRRRRSRNYAYRGADLTPRHIIRALIGARVRKALKRKDVGERIAVLLNALKNLDSLAMLVAKRMKHRLTRLWAILAAPTPTAPFIGSPAPALVFADSS